jgi:hypothetical protein
VWGRRIKSHSKVPSSNGPSWVQKKKMMIALLAKKKRKERDEKKLIEKK